MEGKEWKEGGRRISVFLKTAPRQAELVPRELVLLMGEKEGKAGALWPRQVLVGHEVATQQAFLVLRDPDFRLVLTKNSEWVSKQDKDWEKGGTQMIFRFKELPREIEEVKFGEFLQKIEEYFPDEEYPEIFVQYYKTDGKVIVLGMGENGECAMQTIQSLEKIPSLKGKQLQLKILRTTKERFILR